VSVVWVSVSCSVLIQVADRCMVILLAMHLRSTLSGIGISVQWLGADEIGFAKLHVRSGSAIAFFRGVIKQSLGGDGRWEMGDAVPDLPKSLASASELVLVSTRQRLRSYYMVIGIFTLYQFYLITNTHIHTYSHIHCIGIRRKRAREGGEGKTRNHIACIISYHIMPYPLISDHAVSHVDPVGDA
jgi:hypothetical protein